MQVVGTQMKPFKYLCKLVPIASVIPYSNVETEQLFSMVKDKTDSHSCLKQSGTLSNLLEMETFHCY